MKFKHYLSNTFYNQHKHIRPQKKIDSIRTLRMSLWKRQKRMILSELLTEVVPRKELDRSLPSSTIFLSLEIFNTWSLCWMYRIIKCLNFLLLCKHIQTRTRRNESLAYIEYCFPIKVGFLYHDNFQLMSIAEGCSFSSFDTVMKHTCMIMPFCFFFLISPSCVCVCLYVCKS